MIRFVFSLCIALGTIAGVSLAWPTFTTVPMPAFLTKVHDVVIKTPVGAQVASVLGVSSDASVPVDLQELATSAASDIVSGIEEKIRGVVVGQMVLQLQRQIEKLPTSEQVKAKDAICRFPIQDEKR